MALLLTTPPTAEPLALADTKAHLRLTITDDDAYISSLIIAARRAIESRYTMALMPQTWAQFLDCWPQDGLFHIPLWPVQSVLSLTVFADDDTSVTIDPSNYYMDLATRPSRLALRQGRVFAPPGRNINGLKISFIAGFGADATAVPSEIKEGLMATIADWYQNRGDVAGGTLPATATEALAAYKNVRLA
ncbi:MAG: phage head-tail connector protein [Aestuariivirga sp.]